MDAGRWSVAQELVERAGGSPSGLSFEPCTQRDARDIRSIDFLTALILLLAQARRIPSAALLPALFIPANTVIRARIHNVARSSRPPLRIPRLRS